MARGKRRLTLRNLVKRSSLVGFGLLVGLLLVEGILRLLYGAKFEKRPHFYEPHAELARRPTPGLDHTFYARDFSIGIATDDFGHRIDSRGPIDFTKPFIVMLGDSYTFGWGVQNDETFPAYLGGILNTNGGLQVANLGVGGYSTMQSVLRLENLLTHADPNQLRLVFLLHSPNDMTDNVRFLMFQHGYFTFERIEKVTSDLHVVNFLNWIKWNLRLLGGASSSGTGEATDPQDQNVDTLNSFKRVKSGKNEALIFLDDRQVIEKSSVTPLDSNPKKTLESGRLTELQRKLLALSLEDLHCAVRGKALPILHAVGGYAWNDSDSWAPDWYVEEIRKVVEAAPACGNNIIFLGSVPTDGFVGPIKNAHRGRHFSPQFNEYVAGLLYGWITEPSRS